MTGGGGNGGAHGGAGALNVACGANACSTTSNSAFSMLSSQVAAVCCVDPAERRLRHV